jgi:transposase
MLGRRAAQQGLFRTDHLCRDHVGSDTFYGSLSRLGPELFKDEEFAGLYRDEHGRPSVPPSQLCIALLLQTYEGVSDEEAIERTAYDLRWKVALGLELDEKLCAKSTLQLFRAKLVVHEQYGQIFEASVSACRRAGLLKRRKLDVAIDTTPVLGRGAVKDTYNLLSDQIRTVVQEACALKSWERDAVISEHGLSRHFSASVKGAVELDWDDPAARRALIGQLVADARVALALATRALRGFARTAEPTQILRRARELLADLLQQDIEEEPADGGGPALRQGTSRDRIVSTTDPQMRHGHKSHSKGFEGYKAGLVTEVEHGVILATDVRAANVADATGAKAAIEQAAACADRRIGRVFGDTAYGNLATRRELQSCAERVVSKAPPLPHRRGCFSIDDFVIDARHGVAHCPAGKRSRRRARVLKPALGWRYMFSRTDCRACPLRAQCTTGKHSARMITVTETTRALQKLRRQQSTPAFRSLYRLRVVVEHRLARLCQLGIRQARYFGPAKIAFQLALAAAVANFSLAIAHSGSSFAHVLLGLAPLIAVLAMYARWIDSTAYRRFPIAHAFAT